MEKYLYREVKPFKANDPLKIDSICVLWIADDSQPDFLGEFSNEPKEGAIDREKLGEHSPHEYRYFNPANFDPAYPEDAMQDYRRYEAFCRGEWSLEGCMARAVVSYPIGNGSRRLDHLSSGGIWGIESDSEETYRLETEIEQLSDLKRHLEVFQIPWTDKEEASIQQRVSQLAERLKADRAKLAHPEIAPGKPPV